MSAMTAEKIETLDACFGTYPQTQALKSGQIRSDRVALRFTEVNPINRAFLQMVRQEKFDVSEMAIATYLQAKAYGKPLMLLPATMMGRFQHGTMLYNAERGTVTPENLAGRRVGVRAFSQTTGVWLRGILWKDYGVDLGKVHWVTFEDAHVLEYRDPPGVERAAEGKDILKMLLDGELDAAIFGGNMPNDPRLKSVIPDPDDRGQAMVRKARHRADQSPGRGQKLAGAIGSGRGARSVPHAARQQEGRRPAEARRDRHHSVRIQCREAGAGADVELCAGNEDHSPALFGRGIVRRHHARIAGLAAIARTTGSACGRRRAQPQP